MSRPRSPRPSALLAIALTGALASSVAPASARAAAPADTASAHGNPPADTPPAYTKDAPEDGPNRAPLLLAVGALLVASGVGLVTFGGFEFSRAQDHLAQCQALAMAGGEISTACSFDPPPLAFASAGLSWGLSLPLFVGGGLLLARGVKLERARRRPQLSVAPRLELGAGARLRGGGAALVLLF